MKVPERETNLNTKCCKYVLAIHWQSPYVLMSRNAFYNACLWVQILGLETFFFYSQIWSEDDRKKNSRRNPGKFIPLPRKIFQEKPPTVPEKQLF